MLRKLLKHEFRATGRVMLPMYLVLLVTAAASNVAGRGMQHSRSSILNVLAVLIIAAFAIAIAGTFILAFVLMIQRFYKNLLQDEGYLMFTLPVSVHQHIWAKLIVSAAWFAATALAVILAVLVVSYDVGFMREFFSWLGQLLRELRQLKISDALNGTVILAEAVLLMFLSMMAFCLQFYAALAAGHSRPGHKMVRSVALFFCFQFMVQFGGSVLFMGVDASDILHVLNNWDPSPMMALHVGMLLVIACTVLYGAIFYAATTFFLKRQLNLE